MQLFAHLQQLTTQAISQYYNINIENQSITISETKPDFEGDYTIVIFSILKHVKGNPVEIGHTIGEYLKNNSNIVNEFNVIKGFLNLTISNDYFVQFAQSIDDHFWQLPSKNNKIVLEYIGPNTNKPLHLGHVRNMLLGHSTAAILQAAGNQVHKVNIYNDRGIAICKSMVAWEDYAQGETPESTGLKGDHFVGKYYVTYAQKEDEQAKPFLEQGLEKREAAKQTAIYQKAQNYLLKWEQGDKHVLDLWNKLNQWVYQGLEQTYEELGIDFEQAYYESKTYKHGKEIIQEGLQNGTFYQQEDNSVAVDLEDVGLDQKVLLRGDGTSLYITQDIGTADLRYQDYQMDQSIYVVGNEQDYHFKVLKESLLKLGKPYAEGIHHLSYGMVDLPEGKMKSREGTVVDADMLIQEMKNTAKSITQELGKIDEFSDQEKEKLFHMLGMGALKFFILRVDPKKHILFNPQESIQFQGFTGPYVQYTYARIQSILRKAGQIEEVNHSSIPLEIEEKEVIKLLHFYPEMIAKAAEQLNTSEVAKYAYDLAKTFNQFYANVSVNKEENATIRSFRIMLCKRIADTIKHSLYLLGIQAPKQM